MEKKIKKTLLRAEKILTKYNDDDSIYYRELQKSYKELKKLELPDKTTLELYIEHIEKLCDFIIQKKYAYISITIMIIFFFFTIALTTYTSYKYYDISVNLKNNIIKANRNTSLMVNYKELESFNAITLSDEENYLDLNPLTLSLMAESADGSSYKVHYDIYLIEENDDLNANEVIDRSAFLYNVSTSTKDDGIKRLGNSKVKDDKILIFSGELNTNSNEVINIRMWLDSQTDKNNLNKKYRFKLYVDGKVL